MATPGRKPKPAAQRRREGKAGHRPIKEAWDARGCGPPPDYLTGFALEFWNDTIRALDKVGSLDLADRPVLETWAAAYDRFRTALAMIDEDGLGAFGSMGQPVLHPMMDVVRESQATVLKIAAEFGATAAARARIDVARHLDEGGDIFERTIGLSPRLQAVK